MFRVAGFRFSSSEWIEKLVVEFRPELRDFAREVMTIEVPPEPFDDLKSGL